MNAERLRELLSYDGETGEFVWRVTRGSRACAGSVAGCVNVYFGGRQYQQICIDSTKYLAHRLVWLYVHGRWPTHCIDHIDGNGINNQISNLREASISENLQNRRAATSNKSGFKGVVLDKQRKKWRATITVNGQHRHLGRFDTPEAAHAAYCAAAVAFYGDFANFGAKE
jgi:hypothetical protein